MIASAQRTDSGAIVATGKRLRGLVVRATATGGTVVVKDGGASGTTKLTLNTPAAVGLHVIEIPGPGIQFVTDIYAVLTSVDGITAFYDE